MATMFKVYYVLVSVCCMSRQPSICNRPTYLEKIARDRTLKRSSVSRSDLKKLKQSIKNSILRYLRKAVIKH